MKDLAPHSCILIAPLQSSKPEFDVSADELISEADLERERWRLDLPQGLEAGRDDKAESQRIGSWFRE